MQSFFIAIIIIIFAIKPERNAKGVSHICIRKIREIRVQKKMTRRSPTDRTGGNFTDAHGFLRMRNATHLCKSVGSVGVT